MKLLVVVCVLAVASTEMVMKGYPKPMTYICNFSDDLCGFHSNITKLEWTAVSDKDGRYLKTEAKGDLDKSAVAISRCYSVTNHYLCLAFRYSITGSSDNKMTIQQKGGDKSQVWSSATSSLNKGWIEEKIAVSLLPLQRKTQVSVLVFPYKVNMNYI
ncbi:hypothetical protein SNE40_002571 [Patella caerulea]|uniref:MAM domain-containing protein n=1 Tax=Patella caerulea TaxID=87958 RepID=A0AAN8K813_PATCE